MWLKNSVATIAAVCLVVSIVECAAGDDAQHSELRLLSGAIAAASIMQLVVDSIEQFL